MYVCMDGCVCVCVCVCMYVCTYVYVCMYLCMCVYVRTYERMYVCMYVLRIMYYFVYCVYTLYLCVSANFAIIIIIIITIIIVVVVDLYSQQDPVMSNSCAQSQVHSFCRNAQFPILYPDRRCKHRCAPTRLHDVITGNSTAFFSIILNVICVFCCHFLIFELLCCTRVLCDGHLEWNFESLLRKGYNRYLCPELFL
jgi:hypothetical protein